MAVFGLREWGRRLRIALSGPAGPPAGPPGDDVPDAAPFTDNDLKHQAMRVPAWNEELLRLERARTDNHIRWLKSVVVCAVAAVFALALCLLLLAYAAARLNLPLPYPALIGIGLVGAAGLAAAGNLVGRVIRGRTAPGIPGVSTGSGNDAGNAGPGPTRDGVR